MRQVVAKTLAEWHQDSFVLGGVFNSPKTRSAKLANLDSAGLTVSNPHFGQHTNVQLRWSRQLAQPLCCIGSNVCPHIGQIIMAVFMSPIQSIAKSGEAGRRSISPPE
jgi:hypothetical protein